MVDLSNFGLGTVQFGLDYGFTKKKTQNEVNDILNTAVKNDVTLIDTAREYGDSEAKIGNFMEEHDNDFVIATKLSLIDDVANVSASQLKDHIYNSVEESLGDLKLDKIPILQLHQVDEYLYQNKDFWNVISQLKEDNLIDRFGISVYDVESTNIILDNNMELIDYFQVPYNIFDRRFDAIHDCLVQNNIELISRSTFLKGIIPCGIDEIPEGLEDIKEYKLILESIADELGMQTAELATLFVYHNNNISSTIFGVNSSEELQANIDSINKFDKDVLDDVEFSKLQISDLKLIDPRLWSNF